MDEPLQKTHVIPQCVLTFVEMVKQGEGTSDGVVRVFADLWNSAEDREIVNLVGLWQKTIAPR